MNRVILPRAIRSFLLAGSILLVARPAPARAELQGPPDNQATAPAASAIPKGIKLILKDGTIHVVRSYEQQGDRVRFYSVERSAWEELPAAFVDWEATKAAAAADKARVEEIDSRIRDTKQRQLAAEVDVDASLEIAPGVYLPDPPGLYVVEGSTPTQMDVSEAQVKRNKGRLLAQIFSPVPIIPSQHTVKLEGARADLRITSATPEFYVRTQDGHEPELELLRAQVKGNARIVEKISTVFTGERLHNRAVIGTQRWLVARGVYRVTLGESLTPGEYVLVERQEGAEMELGVWPFGVDLASAAKTAPNKPAPRKSAKKPAKQ